MNAPDILHRFKLPSADGTPEQRKSAIISMRAVGTRAEWRYAAALALADEAMDWRTDGYGRMFDWVADLEEANGLERPTESDYHTFQRRVRCGYLWLNLHRNGENADMLESVGFSKADKIFARIRDIAFKDIVGLVVEAQTLSRVDVARRLEEYPRQVAGKNGGAVVGGKGVEHGAGDEGGGATGERPMFDAEREAPAPAPIPPDVRPQSTVRITCPCGRVHVVSGSVDEVWEEKGERGNG